MAIKVTVCGVEITCDTAEEALEVVRRSAVVSVGDQKISVPVGRVSVGDMSTPIPADDKNRQEYLAHLKTSTEELKTRIESAPPVDRSMRVSKRSIAGHVRKPTSAQERLQAAANARRQTVLDFLATGHKSLKEIVAGVNLREWQTRPIIEYLCRAGKVKKQWIGIRQCVYRRTDLPEIPSPPLADPIADTINDEEDDDADDEIGDTIVGLAPKQVVATEVETPTPPVVLSDGQKVYFRPVLKEGVDYDVVWNGNCGPLPKSNPVDDDGRSLVGSSLVQESSVRTVGKRHGVSGR